MSRYAHLPSVSHFRRPESTPFVRLRRDVADRVLDLVLTAPVPATPEVVSRCRRKLSEYVGPYAPRGGHNPREFSVALDLLERGLSS